MNGRDDTEPYLYWACWHCGEAPKNTDLFGLDSNGKCSKCRNAFLKTINHEPEMIYRLVKAAVRDGLLESGMLP